MARITGVENGAKLLKTVVSEGRTAPELSELTGACGKSFTEHSSSYTGCLCLDSCMQGGMVEVENKIRLLVVDDFKCFREWICTKLKTDGRFFIVGEAANARDAIQKARELTPDLILLDLVLPDMSGVDVLRELRTAVPSPKVLFLSGWGDESIVHHVLSKGARGYVLKGNAHQELIAAIEAAFLGRTFVSSGLKKPHKAAEASLFQLADAT